MLKKFLQGLIVPLCLLSGAAMAADKPLPPYAAESPGRDVDRANWEFFAHVASPVPGGVLFETWATDPDTYPANGVKPVWPGGLKTAAEGRFQVSQLLHGRLRQAGTAPFPGAANCTPHSTDGNLFPKNGCLYEEVRRNRPTFDYIVQNGLYTNQGFVETAVNPISFPWDSLEVKADWATLEDIQAWLAAANVKMSLDQIRQNYYTTRATVTVNGSDKLEERTLGMLGLHIEAKQMNGKPMPNWVWSTFEHELNPGRCDVMGCWDKFGADKAVVKPYKETTLSHVYGSCKKPKELQALFKKHNLDKVFEHYCLKGSQTEYVNAKGVPLLDGNSLIEPVNAGVPMQSVSCISCHATAGYTVTTDKAGKQNAVFNGDLSKDVIGNYTLPQGMKTLDFVWGPINVLKPPSQ